MDKPNSSTNMHPFIEAFLEGIRLVSERANSLSAGMSKEPQQVQLNVEGTSGFTVGLDDPHAPKNLQIEIDYRVVLKLLNSENRIAEYEAKHAAQFAIRASGGFEDWKFPPAVAISPYLAMLQRVAVQRAESTLLEMGFRGIALPMPANFDGAISAATKEVAQQAAAPSVTSN